MTDEPQPNLEVINFIDSGARMPSLGVILKKLNDITEPLGVRISIGITRQIMLENRSLVDALGDDIYNTDDYFSVRSDYGDLTIHHFRTLKGDEVVDNFSTIQSTFMVELFERMDGISKEIDAGNKVKFSDSVIPKSRTTKNTVYMSKITIGAMVNNWEKFQKEAANMVNLLFDNEEEAKPEDIGYLEAAHLMKILDPYDALSLIVKTGFLMNAVVPVLKRYNAEFKAAWKDAGEKTVTEVIADFPEIVEENPDAFGNSNLLLFVTKDRKSKNMYLRGTKDIAKYGDVITTNIISPLGMVKIVAAFTVALIEEAENLNLDRMKLEDLAEAVDHAYKIVGRNESPESINALRTGSYKDKFLKSLQERDKDHPQSL